MAAALGLATLTLLVATVTIPAATADNIDDVVENISKAKEATGEGLSLACDQTTANLDKRGKLTYNKDTGALKYDTSSADSAD